MAQNIGKKRGKSSIKTRLEQERKAGRKNPEGKKAFQKAVSIASLAIPGSLGVKAATKVAKAAKAAKKKVVKKVAKKTREFNKNLAESNKMVDTKLGMKDQVRAQAEGVPIRKSSGVSRKLKPSAKDKSVRSLIKNIKEFKKNYGADNLTRFISGIDKPKKGMKKGGAVKKTKAHRGDGIAKRGRTRGRII